MPSRIVADYKEVLSTAGSMQLEELISEAQHRLQSCSDSDVRFYRNLVTELITVRTGRMFERLHTSKARICAELGIPNMSMDEIFAAMPKPPEGEDPNEYWKRVSAADVRDADGDRIDVDGRKLFSSFRPITFIVQAPVL